MKQYKLEDGTQSIEVGTYAMIDQLYGLPQLDGIVFDDLIEYIMDLSVGEKCDIPNVGTVTRTE